ncbi:MAG: hypothetical protein ABJF50_12630 [Paracoccaceae bacterium]
MQSTSGTFDIVIVAQSGRLTYEAVMFVASLRTFAPDFNGEIYVCEPQPGALWPKDPRIDDLEARGLLLRLGAKLLPFESIHFGARYPHGNKVEALAALPAGRPFVFFDTDTLITGPIDALPFDFETPSASMARENTWPTPPLYGPGYTAIWRAIYNHFGVPFEATLDLSEPDEHWRRYLYFNAGWFFHSCPNTFGKTMIDIMTGVRDDDLPELASQTLYPWLDQIALPVAIAKHSGGRPPETLNGLDGDISIHWRALPLFYAKASSTQLAKFDEVVRPNRIKKVLKTYEPFKRMIYHGRGDKVRALFDQDHLPIREKVIRNRIKRERLWMR